MPNTGGSHFQPSVFNKGVSVSVLILNIIVLSYSGEMAGVGVAIEDCTGKVWDSVFQPMLNKVMTAT